MALRLLTAAAVVFVASALYDERDPVVILDDNNFSQKGATPRGHAL